MPAYNAEGYVSLAVASILGQSLTDFELIVVDDASTDSTATIVKAFGDARIVYVRTRGRSGAGGARNMGLGLARGEYVAFLDADDLAYPERLATQVAYMDSQPRIALLGAGYDVISSAGTVLTTLTEPSGTGSVRLRMLFDNVIATSLAFARRDMLLDAGPFDERLPVGEDHDMWARVASRHAIARMADVLGAYREHTAGTYGGCRTGADEIRAGVASRALESCLGLEVSAETAMILASASTCSDPAVEDSVVAVALLEVIPLSPAWTWAESPGEQRAMTRVLIDKLVTVASKDPTLHREALRAATGFLRYGGARFILDHASLRSLVRLVLAPGGRSRCGASLMACRRAVSRVAGTRRAP
jgi:hypothetical protein